MSTKLPKVNNNCLLLITYYLHMFGIKLQNQENIVHIARKHGGAYFLHWFFSFILITVPFFAMFWLFRHDWWGQAIFFVLLGGGILFLFRTIFLWKRNSAIITTHRVVDVDQRGIFDKTVSEILYDELDYASGQIKGVFGTIFRYGDLIIQNEGGNMRIILEKIKQPVQVQQQINKLKKNYNRGGSNFVCTQCGLEEAGLLDILSSRMHELEVEELIKFKKILDKKIRKML